MPVPLSLGLQIFLREDPWKSQKIRTSGLWLGAIKRRNPRIVRALKTAPSKSAGVPSKGTGTPPDLPQASDAQAIREDIDQWMKRKEEEFAKFMAAHKKTSDRLTELALQEIKESPLTDEIMAQAPPPKFVIPKINVYNGTAGPTDHLLHYRNIMALNTSEDYLMCLPSQPRRAGISLVP